MHKSFSQQITKESQKNKIHGNFVIECIYPQSLTNTNTNTNISKIIKSKQPSYPQSHSNFKKRETIVIRFNKTYIYMPNEGVNIKY